MPAAYYDPEDFEAPEPGMGLPPGWATYSWATAEPVEISRRCEAVTVASDMVRRCLLGRGHDGLHMVHP